MINCIFDQERRDNQLQVHSDVRVTSLSGRLNNGTHPTHRTLWWTRDCGSVEIDVERRMGRMTSGDLGYGPKTGEIAKRAGSQAIAFAFPSIICHRRFSLLCRAG
jgi:hypothetical protein